MLLFNEVNFQDFYQTDCSSNVIFEIKKFNSTFDCLSYNLVNGKLIMKLIENYFDLYRYYLDLKT